MPTRDNLQTDRSLIFKMSAIWQTVHRTGGLHGSGRGALSGEPVPSGSGGVPPGREVSAMEVGSVVVFVQAGAVVAVVMSFTPLGNIPRLSPIVKQIRQTATRWTGSG